MLQGESKMAGQCQRVGKAAGCSRFCVNCQARSAAARPFWVCASCSHVHNHLLLPIPAPHSCWPGVWCAVWCCPDGGNQSGGGRSSGKCPCVALQSTHRSRTRRRGSRWGCSRPRSRRTCPGTCTHRSPAKSPNTGRRGRACGVHTGMKQHVYRPAPHESLMYSTPTVED